MNTEFLFISLGIQKPVGLNTSAKILIVTPLFSILKVNQQSSILI